MAVFIGAIILIGLFIVLVHDHPLISAIIVALIVGLLVFYFVKKYKEGKQIKEQEEAKRKEEETKRLAAAKEAYKAAERQKQYREKKIAQFNESINAIERIEPIMAMAIERRKEEPPEFKISNLTKKTNLSALFPIVVIDTETTGLSSRQNKIIEVSAIKITEGFEIESAFSTLCNPGSPIPENASKINHITDDMVKDMPAFGEIASSLSDYIKGCNIAGYNTTFDLKFLWNNGIDFDAKTKFIDVMMLWKPKLKKENFKNSDSGNYDVSNYKLETLARYFNIIRDDAHRSLSDCMVTKMLLEEYVNEYLN